MLDLEQGKTIDRLPARAGPDGIAVARMREGAAPAGGAVSR